jgi:dTDP-4-dehydrorhamnose reductase
MRITLVTDLENYENSLKVLVLGGSGQIGSEIRAYQDNINFSMTFPSSSELNLKNKKKITDYLNSHSFDIILNLAAYTAVDKAETDKKISDQINHIGPKLLAQEAQKRNIGLIHISTDYVFGKNGSGPYKNSDPKNPINYYGHTKSLGEDQVLLNHDKSLVIRLASVFGEYGNNFVKTITRKLHEENDVRLVSDQLISLTYSNDFAKNLKEIIILYQSLGDNIASKDRILHFTSCEHTDWFSVGSIIYDEIEKFKKSPLSVKLIPISSSEWSSDAQRSLDTRLKVDYKFLKERNINVFPWQESVRLVVRKILSNIEG